MAIVNLETHAEPMVTPAELAVYWRVSVRTVHYAIDKGALPATRVGRVLRVKTEDARKYGRMSDVVTAPVASL